MSDSESMDGRVPNERSTAGVVAHVAGQDTSAEGGVAGAAPSGGPIDGASRPDAPTSSDIDDAGETVADDELPLP